MLIVHGDRDAIVPIAYSKKAKEIFENAEMITITGGVHAFEGRHRQMAAEYALNYINNQLMK